jgi:hypothetical protein
MKDLLKKLEAVKCTVQAGTFGWYKYLMGIDQASKDLADTRMRTCLRCVHRRKRPLFDQCAVCYCVLQVKTKIASTSCDLGKW